MCHKPTQVLRATKSVISPLTTPKPCLTPLKAHKSKPMQSSVFFSNGKKNIWNNQHKLHHGYLTHKLYADQIRPESKTYMFHVGHYGRDLPSYSSTFGTEDPDKATCPIVQFTKELRSEVQWQFTWIPNWSVKRQQGLWQVNGIDDNTKR